MKRPIVYSLVLIILFSVQAVFSSACSCIVPAPSKESLGQSAAVFLGKVQNIEDTKGLFELGQSSIDPIKVTFEVSKVWKGLDYKTITVTTARSGASCGYSFEKGKEYLVYAYGKENDLNAGLCSRTAPVENAQQDLKDLGEGKIPSIGIPNQEQKSNIAAIASIIAITLVLGTLVTLFLRKKK